MILFRKVIFSFICLGISFSGMAQLSGTYSVGGDKGYFPTLDSAFNTLNRDGLSGPVTLNLQFKHVQGAYELVSLTGSKASQKLTIQTHPDSSFVAIIQALDTNLPALNLKRIKHLQLNRIYFKAPDSSAFRPFTILQIQDSSQYLEVSNCRFYGLSRTKTSFPYFAYRSNGIQSPTNGTTLKISNLRIANNTFDNCREAISINCTVSEYVSIENNHISNFEYNGIFIFGAKHVRVKYNTVLDLVSAKDFDMIKLSGGGEDVEVSGNYILTRSVNKSRGINLYSVKGTANEPVRVCNNVIIDNDYNSSSSLNFVGIMVALCQHVDVVHNSAKVGRNGASGYDYVSTPCLVMGSGGKNQGDIRVLNNVFIGTGYKGNYAFAINVDARAAGYISKMDYNVFWEEKALGVGLIYDHNVTKSLKTWRSSYKLDSNSIEYHPIFRSKEDLHLHIRENTLDSLSPYLSAYPYDYDSSLREKPFTDPGFAEHFVIRNDAELLHMSDPICWGKQALAIQLHNYGYDSLLSFKLIRETSTDSSTWLIVDTLNIFAKAAFRDTFWVDADSLYFPINRDLLVRLRIIEPNGKKDEFAENNTFIKRVNPPMSGKWTIKDSTSLFVSLDEAFNYLNLYGICGDVEFLLQKDSSSQFEIKKFPVGSSAYKVKVKGDPQNGDTIRVVAPTFISSTSNYVVSFAGDVSNIEFSNISFESRNGNYARVITFIGNQENIRFDHCRFIGSNYTGNDTKTAIIRTLTGTSKLKNFELNNCYLRGGIKGVWLNANSGYLHENIQIDSCDIKGYLMNGIEAKNTNGLTISHCALEDNQANDIGFCVNLEYLYGNTLISHNHFKDKHSASRNVFWLQECKSAQSINIYNNLIESYPFNTSQGSALYASTSQNLDINHNTIRSFTTTALRINCYNSTKVRNNILNCGNDFIVEIAYSQYLDSMDYNSFYWKSTPFNKGIYVDSVFADIGSWRKSHSNKYGAHSIIGDPLFVSNTIAIPKTAMLNGVAQFPGNISYDLYGKKRDSLPDIGAIEFEPIGLDVELFSHVLPDLGKCGKDSIHLGVIIRNLGSQAATGMTVSTFYRHRADTGTITDIYHDTLLSGKADTFWHRGIPSFDGTYFDFCSHLSNWTDSISDDDSLCTKDMYTPERALISLFPAQSECPGSNVAVQVNHPADRIVWYHSDTSTLPFKTGNKFTINSLKNDTVFFYETITVRNNTAGTNVSGTQTLINPASNKSGRGLAFSNETSISIDSITVYAQGGPGQLRFVIWDLASKKMVDSTSFLTVQRLSTLQAVRYATNLKVDSGSYILGVEYANIDGLGWRNSTNYNFPSYSDDYSVKLNGTYTDFNTSSKDYGFFFDLKINQYLCYSTRIKYPVHAKDQPIVDLGRDTSYCADEGITKVLRAPKNPEYTYWWSTNEYIDSITVKKAGTYNLIVTGKNGCRGAGVIQITENKNPSIDLGADTSFCPNVAILKVLEILDSFPKYLWQDNSVKRSYEAKDTGTFHLKVWDDKGCSGMDSVIIKHWQVEILDLGGDTQFCKNDLFQLTIDAGNRANYLWSTTSTQRAIQADKFGLYGVTVTDDHLCVQEDSLQIIPFNSPILNLGEDVKYCLGDAIDTVVKTGDVFDQYRWSNGASTSSIEILETGTYSVSVVDEFGCNFSDELQVQITNIEDVLDIGSDTAFCENVVFYLGLSASLNSAHYLWSNGASTQSIQVKDFGWHWLRTVDSNGCSLGDSLFVLTHDNPKPYLGLDSLFNPKHVINETLKTQKAYATYLWNDGSQGPQLVVDSEGTYWVEVSDSNACIGRDSVELRYWNPVAVKEVSAPEMLIFPNPSSGKIYVRANGLTLIEIFDLKGDIVYSATTNEKEIEIKIDGLSKGIYLLRGYSGHCVWEKKVAKF
jgi:hypothetical protein